MKPICHLPGPRCAFTDGLRLQAASVSADDLDRRMVSQPPCCAIDTPIIENADDRASLEINHDSAVSRRSPPTPVIDANHPNLGGAVRNRGIPLQLPQYGVVVDRHTEPLHQALARAAARAMTEQPDNLHDPRRPERIRGSNLRQSVGECLSLTFLMCASPAAQPELHRYGLALRRQILKAAVGPAMPTSAPSSAIGANADRGSGSGNNATAIDSERDIQNFNPWAGRPFRFPLHARP